MRPAEWKKLPVAAKIPRCPVRRIELDKVDTLAPRLACEPGDEPVHGLGVLDVPQQGAASGTRYVTP